MRNHPSEETAISAKISSREIKFPFAEKQTNFRESSLEDFVWSRFILKYRYF